MQLADMVIMSYTFCLIISEEFDLCFFITLQVVIVFSIVLDSDTNVPVVDTIINIYECLCASESLLLVFVFELQMLKHPMYF